MDTSGIIVVTLLVSAIIVVAMLFRRGSFRAGMKGPFGASLDVEARGAVESTACKAESDPAKSAQAVAAGFEASGAAQQSIRVGRDAHGAFVTGDSNRVAQVRGNRNRVDQTGEVK